MSGPAHRGGRRDHDVPTTGGRRWRAKAGVAALLVAGGSLISWGLAGHDRSSPAPPSPLARYAAPAGSAAVAEPAVRPLPESPPKVLEIPAIGVRSQLLQLGLNPDGTIQVPPLTRDSRAGWYQGSPTPGQLGPAVILGHVDSARYGPAVFFKLGAIRPGNLVRITRADRRVAIFRVDRVAEYPKTQFPTAHVYGNVEDAELRLITCGGDFDRSRRSYDDNVVVYASLI